MKIPIPVACSNCGCDFSALGYGKERFPPAKCPDCGQLIHIIDPLTISIIADRLLYRSMYEVDEGDPTVSIIFSAMAVECALTEVFLKWKKLDHERATHHQATDHERGTWEEEYRKQTGGGFTRAADVVSKLLRDKKYDELLIDFLGRSNRDALTKSGFPPNDSKLKAAYIQQELFNKRNRIVHWGDMTYQKEDASRGLTAASNAIAVFKVMDRERYEAMEREFRAIRDAEAKRYKRGSR
jgi:hypothetical protein